MKRSYWIIILFIVIIIQSIFIVNTYRSDQDTTLSNDYYVVFKGETGERVNSTYLYISKKKYKYVNTISNSSGFDSANWNEEIIKKGTLKKKKRMKIFDIVEKHGAYSYVKYQNGEIVSIEEFRKSFKNAK